MTTTQSRPFQNIRVVSATKQVVRRDVEEVKNPQIGSLA